MGLLNISKPLVEMIEIVNTSVIFSTPECFIKNNIALLIFAFIGIIVSLIYTIPLKDNKKGNRILNKFLLKDDKIANKFLWIYSSLIPSIFLIILRYDKYNLDKLRPLKILDYIVILILILIIFIPLFIQLHILKTDFKTPPERIGEMQIKEIHSVGLGSLKLMEYFVVLILPFITIGNSFNDGLTIFYVFAILIIIFFRLELFYFNLPIMIYYHLHEVTLSDEKKYFLISKSKNLEINRDVPRKIIILSEELKIAILIK